MSPTKDVATGDAAEVKATKVKKNHGHVRPTKATILLEHCAELKRVPVRRRGGR